MIDIFDFQNVLLILTLCCAAPVILLTGLFIFALYTGKKIVGGMIQPDVARLQARFEQLQAKHPDASREELVGKILSRQAFNAGMIGALTSFGGIFVLPFMLTVDIYASLKLQTTLVYFIAHIYGHEQINMVEKSAIEYIVVTGGNRLARQSKHVTSYMAGRVAIRVSEKALAKIIPIIGAVVGFGVNYFMAQATGRSAMQYYAGNLKLRGGRQPQLKD